MYFYPLFSGSSGNCSVVRRGSSLIMVDAGLPGRTITDALEECKLNPCDISAIVVTHEHSDHIKGVGVMSRRFNIPIYANARTWDAMDVAIGPIRESNVRIFETGHEFFIKGINVLPFKIPHDSVEPVGYAFSCDGRRLCVATDIGHVNNALISALDGSSLVLIESNHDVDMLKSGPYPQSLKRRILGENGHLSNENCGKLLSRLYERGLVRAVLGHLSRDNNREDLALATVRDTLENADIPCSAFRLDVAHRDRICGIFEV